MKHHDSEVDISHCILGCLPCFSFEGFFFSFQQTWNFCFPEKTLQSDKYKRFVPAVIRLNAGMFCSLCFNNGGSVEGHGSLPPRKERTERAQCRCSRAGEWRFPGTPCATHPYLLHHWIQKCDLLLPCRATPGFLTNRSVIGGNCIDFLVAKFLFKELQVISVKLSDAAIVTTASSCSAVPQRRTAGFKTRRYLHWLHLQPKLRCV